MRSLVNLIFLKENLTTDVLHKYYKRLNKKKMINTLQESKLSHYNRQKLFENIILL